MLEPVVSQSVIKQIRHKAHCLAEVVSLEGMSLATLLPGLTCSPERASWLSLWLDVGQMWLCERT